MMIRYLFLPITLRKYVKVYVIILFQLTNYLEHLNFQFKLFQRLNSLTKGTVSRFKKQYRFTI